MYSDSAELTSCDIEALVSAKRILVLGPSGAGKTRLTLLLSRLLGIDPIHLDREFWKEEWVSTPQEKWRDIVTGLVQRESWIMDGTYESTLSLRIPAADAVIVLNDPALLRLYRILIRRFGGGDETRPDAPPGQKIDLDYIRYILFFSRSSKPLITKLVRKHGDGKVLVTLSGRRDVEQLLRRLNAYISDKTPTRDH